MRRLALPAMILMAVTTSTAAQARQAASPAPVPEPVPAADAPAEAAEPELNLREAALQTLADTFDRQTREVVGQINAALEAGGEEAEVRARVDAILVPFDRLAGSFAEEVAGFLRWQADEAETPEARDEILAAVGPTVEAVAGLPGQLRVRVNTALAARSDGADPGRP